MQDETSTNKKSWRVLDRYIEHLSIDKSKTTLDIYRRRIVPFIIFMEKRLGATFDAETVKRVDGEAIQDFYIFLQDGRCASTINQYVICVRHFLRHLNGLGWIEDSQLAKYIKMLPLIRIKKTRRDEVVNESLVSFTQEELDMLHDAAKGHYQARNRAIISFMAGTGLRAFELCSLSVGDYRKVKREGKGDDKRVIQCIRKGSGGKKRMVKIAKFAFELVDDYLESRPDAKDDEPLFVTKYNTPMNPNSLWCMLAEIMRSVGLPTGTHNLRRTFLTNVERLGGVAIARDAGGHMSISTTDGYLTPSANDIGEIIDNLPYKEIFEKNFEKEGSL